MINTIIAIVTLLITVVISVQALRIARGFQKNAPEWMDGFIEDKASGMLEAVMAPHPETGQNFIDVLAHRFGTGFRMSLMAQKSGDVRHVKGVKQKVFDAAIDNVPELKAAKMLAEKVGLGDLVNAEDAPILLEMAQKYGLLDGAKGMLGANPRGNNGQSMEWKI